MKTLRFLMAFIAAVSLAAPPTAHAEIICEIYTFRYVGYYPDCACYACGGWAYHNCTECVDTESGGSCQQNGPNPCGPRTIDP